MEREVLAGGPRATVVEIDGSGPSVIYLRGEEGWGPDPVREQLAKSFTVYAPKLADTEECLGDLDGTHDLMVYLNEVMDALDLESASLVGHSFGGMVAAEFAAMNPRRAERTVLLSPLGFWLNDHPVADLFAVDPNVQVKRLFANSESESAQAWLGAASRPDDIPRLRTMRAALHFLFPIPERGLIRRIHRIACPTLIMWGAQDGIAASEYAQEFASMISDSSVEIVDNAAHMLGQDQPEAIARRVTEFLAA